MSSNTKAPNVAGYFYPADPKTLAATVQELLDNTPPATVPVPKAIIAPHAGYIYSGPIAASIYKSIMPHSDKIKRVILLGPAHRLGFLGIAVPQVQYFATPLGAVPVDTASVTQIQHLPGVSILEQAFDMEHSLEVQLPFLQSILTNFSVVPCVVGNANPQDVANLLIKLWGDEQTLIVISSDLSHYLDYASAQKIDAQTTDAIVNLSPEKISDHQACGRIPVKGLLLAAAQQGLHAKVLDLRNSGDTAGDKSRVVGYGAYHFA